MTSTQAGLVRGKVARFTLLDICGNPQLSNSMYVTKGIITVNSTKNMDEGDTISVRQMDGTIGEYEPGQVSLLNFTHEIQLIKVDPGAIAMLTGDPLVLSADGTTTVGWEERALTPIINNFAMEVWTDTAGGACAAGTSKLYGYMLYPMVGQAYVTIDNIGDKEITATIKGVGYGNPQWGRGPYGSISDGSSIRGPVNSAATGTITPDRLLTAVAPNAMRRFEITPVAPPAAFTVPGPVAITLPSPY